MTTFRQDFHRSQMAICTLDMQSRILLNSGLGKGIWWKVSTFVLMIQIQQRKSTEFVNSIHRMILKWLGADWEDRLLFCIRVILIRMYECAVLN